MLSTLTAIIAIALTLHNNPNHTGNALSSPTTKAVQKYDITSSQQYQQKNKEICERLRDSIYVDSEHLEQLNYQYPSDFIIISPQQASENIKNSLKHFDENGCNKNPYIHYSDRNLIQELEKDLNK